MVRFALTRTSCNAYPVTAAALSRVMCSTTLEVGSDGAPPTEFRIFKAGVNETSKGTSVFDAKAAADVMKHYAQKGVDMMIDLEHESADEPIRADSRDARGWFKLELRNGELWAVDVTWTPDGARRLAEKTQRYISPLFYERKDDQRVAWLVNVALVGDPATYGAAPLVAASEGKTPLTGAQRAACYAVVQRAYTQKQGCRMLTPEMVKKILDTIAADDGKAAIALLGEVVAAEAAGGAAEAAEPDNAPGAAGADPLAASADPAKPNPADPNAKALAEVRKELDELKALTTRVNASALESELTERRGLVADLVKLGVELPGHAWLERTKETDPLTPCKRLSDEPIAGLRARVAELRTARGLAPVRAHEAPIPSASADVDGGRTFTTAHGVVKVSASEIKNCEAAGAKLEAYAENKAIREAARTKVQK